MVSSAFQSTCWSSKIHGITSTVQQRSVVHSSSTAQSQAKPQVATHMHQPDTHSCNKACMVWRNLHNGSSTRACKGRHVVPSGMAVADIVMGLDSAHGCSVQALSSSSVKPGTTLIGLLAASSAHSGYEVVRGNSFPACSAHTSTHLYKRLALLCKHRSHSLDTVIEQQE